MVTVPGHCLGVLVETYVGVPQHGTAVKQGREHKEVPGQGDEDYVRNETSVLGLEIQ